MLMKPKFDGVAEIGSEAKDSDSSKADGHCITATLCHMSPVENDDSYTSRVESNEQHIPWIKDDE
eukprot:11193743-Lingulodinium_polyedra.AAC.1